MNVLADWPPATLSEWFPIGNDGGAAMVADIQWIDFNYDHIQRLSVASEIIGFYAYMIVTHSRSFGL